MSWLHKISYDIISPDVLSGGPMKNHPRLHFFAIIFCLVIFLSTAACSKNPPEPIVQDLLAKTSLTPAEQQRVATALFQEMSEADEDNLELFERHYLTVLEKCPETEKAHTAAWRLTNLYSLAYDEPRYEKIIAILEPFLERYTESDVVSMEKYPEDILVFSPLAKLHLAYRELGLHDKIASYYEKATAAGADLSALDCFDFAEALDRPGREKEAVRWYREFLAKTEEGPDLQFMREVARDRIEEIGTGRQI
jgi:tetratricopeptide (TPR) repeat protein